MGGTKKRQLNVWLLRKLCEDRGLTQTELAERSGVDMGHISRIIKGKVRQPGEDIVIAMARAMGVTDPEVLWDTVPAFDLTQTQAKALLLLRELTEEQQDIVLRLAASLARTGH